jgi:uncharacterized protein
MLNHVLMPWKNGQGVTEQIFIYPEDSNISNFQWRLSSATFDTSGPFSFFEQHQRILVQVEGKPIKIIHKNNSTTLNLFEEYCFSGSLETSCEVTSSVRDFNVIYQEDKFKVNFETYTNKHKEIKIKKSGENFLFCAFGEASVDEKKIQKFQTFKLENDVTIEFEKDCIMFHVSIIKK